MVPMPAMNRVSNVKEDMKIKVAETSMPMWMCDMTRSDIIRNG